MQEQPVGTRIPLPIGGKYQDLGVGPIRGRSPEDQPLAAPEGGQRVATRGCPHKLSPNPADHCKTAKPTADAADGYLTVSTDHHLLRIRMGSDWEVSE